MPVEKRYFKIGEVSRETGLAPHVLRFWEEEFPQVRPKRTSTGQRMYSRDDIALIKRIQTLLYEKKFTIPGARAHLSGKTQPDAPVTLGDIRSELLAIRALLEP